MVTTETICRWVETIERERIPSPVWVREKTVFEYEELTRTSVRTRTALPKTVYRG